MKILVVDDEVGWLKTITGILNLPKYEITTAKNYKDAKALLGSTYDLIIVDLKLGQTSYYDGELLLGDILGQNAQTPCIVLTQAFVSSEDVKKKYSNVRTVVTKGELDLVRFREIVDRYGNEKLFTDNQISILFLASDPTEAARLRSGEEFREIKEKIDRSKLRDHFNLELPQLSARSEDISHALLYYQPHIVHFSGHSTSRGELCVEDKFGHMHIVQTDALAALFAQFADHVQCVLLNSCYTEAQGKAIAQSINYVIGMNKEISDRGAIAFTIGFYQAIGAGRSIEDAYKLGCIQIRMQGIPEHLVPILISRS